MIRRFNTLDIIRITEIGKGAKHLKIYEGKVGQIIGWIKKDSEYIYKVILKGKDTTFYLRCNEMKKLDDE